ncbi:MAG: hypothetical protein KY449_13380 [Proteobacteria bacterium]|nr:hypothetical protein [Pseudomonadota bacterium]
MYTFLFVSPNGMIPSFDLAAYPSPEDAYRNAESLLIRWPERRAIEVWDETEHLRTVERSGPTA